MRVSGCQIAAQHDRYLGAGRCSKGSQDKLCAVRSVYDALIHCPLHRFLCKAAHSVPVGCRRCVEGEPIFVNFMFGELPVIAVQQCRKLLTIQRPVGLEAAVFVTKYNAVCTRPAYRLVTESAFTDIRELVAARAAGVFRLTGHAVEYRRHHAAGKARIGGENIK